MLRAIIAIVFLASGLWILESARSGLEVSTFSVGNTPVTEMSKPRADGPVIVIAHGFAGSRQIMQGYSFPFARAGYRVFAFDFLGHGRHIEPMSGDVTQVSGTTQLLVDQTSKVIAAVKSEDQPIALLGHSMATDVLARVALERGDVGPLVLISAFSNVIDDKTPDNLLIVTGAWEPGLREFAVRAIDMVSPEAGTSATVSNGAVTRRAEIIPFAEHVSILHNREARMAALAWVDRAYGLQSEVSIKPTGLGILAVLAGLVLLGGWSARRLPTRDVPTIDLSLKQIGIVTLVPMLASPIIALFLNPGLLPVILAEYLALHLAVFGLIQLLLLRFWGMGIGSLSKTAIAFLLFWSAIVGFCLDRYVANFWPVGARLWIIPILTLGTIPFLLADAHLVYKASFARRLLVRLAFFCSLAIAVSLDFENLFFLIMIAPVIVLFYLVFGSAGRSVGKQSGPSAPGVALGLALAWALGVSFPLFAG